MTGNYDSIWENICKALEKVLPAESYEVWKQAFSLLKHKGSNFVFFCTDEVRGKTFLECYQREVYAAVCTVSAQLATVKYRFAAGDKKKRERAAGYRHGIKSVVASLICLLFATIFAIVGINYVANLHFKENFYSVSANRAYDNFRIVQISDLHSTSYGKNNEKLTERLAALKPDLIMMTGDCLDINGSEDEMMALCKTLSELAPTYYIYGNNECQRAFDCDMTLEALDEKLGVSNDKRDPKKLYAADNGLRAKLESAGVRVLFNESDMVETKKTRVKIFGTLTSNPSAFWPYAGEAFNEFLNSEEDVVKVFLCHEPLLFETLSEKTWGDLALCGDTHGGIVRLPGTGAVYSRNFGMFPERNNHLIYGKYQVGETDVIVSSGLTNRGWIRISNQPELAVIDVNKY